MIIGKIFGMSNGNVDIDSIKKDLDRVKDKSVSELGKEAGNLKNHIDQEINKLIREIK